MPGRLGHRTARGEGGYSVAPVLLLVPLFVLATFLVVQFALYFWARDVALAAARAGARVARAEAGTDPAWSAHATVAARARVDQLAPRLVTNVTITTVTPTPAEVGVEVRADVPTLLPGVFVPGLTARSVGAREQFLVDD